MRERARFAISKGEENVGETEVGRGRGGCAIKKGSVSRREMPSRERRKIRSESGESDGGRGMVKESAVRERNRMPMMRQNGSGIGLKTNTAIQRGIKLEVLGVMLVGGEVLQGGGT